jgi:hypothetical protein
MDVGWLVPFNSLSLIQTVFLKLLTERINISLDIYFLIVFKTRHCYMLVSTIAGQCRESLPSQARELAHEAPE